jgi:hypothetical protein
VQLGLYINKAHIWSDDVRELVQSAVYLAESIYVPATVRAAPVLSEEEQTAIHMRLRELHSIGAVKFWEVEGTKGFLAAQAEKVNLPVDLVVSREQYKEIYEKVIDRLMENRSYFLTSETQVSTEGIAEIVRGKHVLWSFAMKEFLGANDILLDAVNAQNSMLFFTGLLAPSVVGISNAIISEVSMRLNIPDVTQLSIEQIESCRTFMPAFRDDLIAKIKADGGFKFDRTEVIKKTADQIVDRFVGYMLEKKFTLESPDQTVSTWTLNQLLFSQDIQNNSDRFFKWDNLSTSSAPELLLWKLKGEPRA